MLSRVVWHCLSLCNPPLSHECPLSASQVQLTVLPAFYARNFSVQPHNSQSEKPVLLTNRSYRFSQWMNNIYGFLEALPLSYCCLLLKFLKRTHAQQSAVEFHSFVILANTVNPEIIITVYLLWAVWLIFLDFQIKKSKSINCWADNVSIGARF
jgi:hypothetical protein